MTRERIETLLNVGDLLVLWGVVAALVTLFWWHDRESETNSPTLIAPACVSVPTKGSK